VLLAPVGGPDDYTQSSLNATNVVNSLAERLQVRVKVKAGQRQVGAAFLQKPAAQPPGGWCDGNGSVEAIAPNGRSMFCVTGPDGAGSWEYGP